MTGLGRLGRIGSVAVTAAAARLRVGATGQVLGRSSYQVQVSTSTTKERPDAGLAGGRLRRLARFEYPATSYL
jgi:hypothetical protein